MPLLVVSPPLPLPRLFFQPNPFSLDGRGFGLRTHQFRVACTMALAEGVAAGNQRDGFFVVHAHAGEGLTHIATRGDGSGLPFGPSGLT